MPLDYSVAIGVLNDNEKNRMVAIYLNSQAVTDLTTVDWQKATTEFGSASVDSMKICNRNAIKKIEKAMASDGATAPPPTSAKAKGGKKRKAAAEEEAADGGDEEATPKPKARKAKKGKKTTPDADGEDGEAAVKAEEGEDA